MRHADRLIRRARGALRARSRRMSSTPPPDQRQTDHARMAQQIAARDAAGEEFVDGVVAVGVGGEAGCVECEKSVRGSLHRWSVQSVLLPVLKGRARCARQGDGIAMTKATRRSGFSVSDCPWIRSACGAAGFPIGGLKGLVCIVTTTLCIGRGARHARCAHRRSSATANAANGKLTDRVARHGVGFTARPRPGAASDGTAPSRSSTP